MRETAAGSRFLSLGMALCSTCLCSVTVHQSSSFICSPPSLYEHPQTFNMPPPLFGLAKVLVGQSEGVGGGASAGCKLCCALMFCPDSFICLDALITRLKDRQL